MSDVYVLGIDMIKFGRYPNKTVPQLGAEAVNMALDDAGVTMSDIEGLYCGNFYQASGMVGQRILQEVGQSGIPGSQRRELPAPPALPHFAKPGWR